MTDAERVLALQAFGYTPRQAQFLLPVALHSGYFLRRHYVAFIARGHGQATTRFLAGTVARGHVTIVLAGRHGQLFHLSARPVYAALDQEDNRHRRHAEWAAVIRKLLTLDFVLSQPDAQFIATEADKVALLQGTDSVGDTCWPSKRYDSRRLGGRPTVRYFVDKMPWFRRPTDPRLWLTHVNTGDTLAGWETFLIQYRDLLTTLASSGVAYVGLERDTRVRPIFDRVIGRPAGRAVPRDSAAFLDYCRIRQRIEADDLVHVDVAELQRWGRQLRDFAAPRFDALYRRWGAEGDAVLADVNGLKTRLDCALEMHRLPHPYDRHPRSPGRLESVADSHAG